MSRYIGQVSQSVVFLALSGAPVTGLLYSAVVAKVCRASDAEFNVKALTTSNWKELGSGFYSIQWSAADMSELGVFTFTLSGAGFNNFNYGQFDIDPVPLSVFAPPETCIITGNIVDIGGAPGKNQNITFRPVYFPMAENNSLVAADAVRTVPDVFGNFQVLLLQGKLCIVEIERTGIRVQFTVPNASTATLLSLLPPIPN